ncbi:enoyl-CoA hydratase/isomerase family protein [Natronomonas gomsonensis]|jgi:enoyl-CoA hydratase|uniref:enoyl-CoA hydratase/isomerase family protein n=1 Tax=Natronomonas gomsonensis TaxID=1046043 RepID=UPI0020CA281C|nr:enoyl-CoA hydratase/isomerase family protein [Natronomonas gomsonensis]MCY4730945.1 enoyl-CoA hydratase/isomerase family protein [Natronomonas gomsonensis]
MIRVEDGGNVRVVTLDRPERRNALTPAALAELEAAVTDCAAPVVYLRGAGEAFCAGADLSTVATVAERDPDSVEPFVRRGQAVADAIESSSSVVVAGIEGAARGGGVELALACDMRLATPKATFGEPGVTFGLFGAWGGTVRLPEVVGMGDALDFSLSGRVIDAEEALRIGLVSRVVESPQAVAERVAENDSLALEHVKERIRDRGPKSEQEDAEVAAFEALVEAHAEDLRELGE